MQQDYIGDELTLFEQAKNWKAYWSSYLQPYLKGDVLEVGAGLGGTTIALSQFPRKSWTCLEPDPTLTAQLEKKLALGEIPADTTIITGTLSDIPAASKYDCIIYIDVIEHIEDDYAELAHAGRFLKENGTLFVLVPAHQWLFSPFDKAIGHYRRYNKERLKAAGSTSGLTLHSLKYLDTTGLLASSVNKVLLRQSMPTSGQIAFWDKVIVPTSRLIDKLLGNSLGKTVIGIWQNKKRED